MGFNGSGTFNRVRNWVSDAAAHIKIRADYHDDEDDNLAAGLGNCICRDGQSTISADIPWNNKRITNLATPLVGDPASTAATKGYADGKLAKTGDTMTGSLTIQPANGVEAAITLKGLGVANTTITMDKGQSGQQNSILGKTNGVMRWSLQLGNVTAESGSAVGSDFALYRYDDLGAFTGTAFSIARNTGNATLEAALSVGGNLSATGTITAGGNITTSGFVTSATYFISSAASAILAATGAGNVFLRPNGSGNAAGQTIVNSAGTLSVDGNIFAINGLIYGTTSMVVAAQNASVEFRPGGVNDSTTNAFINTSGNFIIKGSIGQKASGTAWSNPSDARLKQVKGPYEGGLAALMQVQPVIYTLLANPELGDQIGVIGQEIEGPMPETIKLVEGEIVVGGEKVVVNDLRQFDATAITFALINAVKELSARVATLEAPAP